MARAGPTPIFTTCVPHDSAGMFVGICGMTGRAGGHVFSFFMHVFVVVTA
jgi:hypothetical protein